MSRPMPLRYRQPRQLAAFAAALIAGSCATALGQDLPRGAVTDCADIEHHGHRLEITQRAPDCVINWESFDIGRGGEVWFLQGGAWRVLNRVSGEGFSRIAGTLTGDGSIYLVNPAGIVFTGSAV